MKSRGPRISCRSTDIVLLLILLGEKAPVAPSSSTLRLTGAIVGAAVGGNWQRCSTSLTSTLDTGTSIDFAIAVMRG
jgi:hypothetical protein